MNVEDGPWTVSYGDPFVITVEHGTLMYLMNRVGGTIHIQNLDDMSEAPRLCRIKSITANVVTFEPITFHVEWGDESEATQVHTTPPGRD